MESVFLKLITSDLVKMTKPKNNKLICYGNSFDLKLIYSLAWIHKYYFEETILVYLPKIVDISSTLETFNELVGDFILTQEDICHCSLESIEIKGAYKVVIYGFADFIFNELLILNKRRTLTYLKNLKSPKIHIIGYSNLKVLDIPVFDSFEYFQFNEQKTFNFDYIDFLEENDYSSLIEFISENKEKSIYLSLSLITSKILEIEKALKESGIDVSRKENENCVVINSPKNIHNSFLKKEYNIYIFITSKIEYPVDILYYLKEINGSCEVYFDSLRMKNINNCIKQINSNQTNQRITIKDSKEYSSYKELISSKTFPQLESVIVSESYYKFEAPENICQFDLSNLTKKEYDTIRNFVKVKLISKMDLDIKTCQLSAPCSPKDRSKKLNSLSNKISSYDYRCDITCEIFSDYTIGVILWNETFANRKTMEIGSFLNQVFIHQTTSGAWKYTTVS